MVLPLRRVFVAFVADLEQAVIEIIDGVDDLPNVILLVTNNARVHQGVKTRPFSTGSLSCVNTNNFVTVIWVSLPRVFPIIGASAVRVRGLDRAPRPQGHQDGNH